MAPSEKTRSLERHVDPRTVAVGRDVDGEALEQLGIVVDRLRGDQEVVEGAAADRVVEDRGDLAMGQLGSLGDLVGTVGGAGQLGEQGLARLLGGRLGRLRLNGRRRGLAARRTDGSAARREEHPRRVDPATGGHQIKRRREARRGPRADGPPWLIARAAEAPCRPGRDGVRGDRLRSDGLGRSRSGLLTVRVRGTTVPEEVRGAAPVRFSPVFCSSQSAARSLAAPSVRPLLSRRAPRRRAAGTLG